MNAHFVLKRLSAHRSGPAGGAAPGEFLPPDAAETLIANLRRTHGPEPDGAQLEVVPATGSRGRSFEVICRFDREVPGSMDYAFRCRQAARGDGPAAPTPATGRVRR